METIQTIDTISPYIHLDTLLQTKIKQESKENFVTFVRTLAPTLVSDWKMGRHIELISHKLQQLESGEIKRLMVFLPPRSSKSVICSKLFPAWYIGRNPEHEILTVSYSDQSGWMPVFLQYFLSNVCQLLPGLFYSPLFE